MNDSVTGKRFQSALRRGNRAEERQGKRGEGKGKWRKGEPICGQSKRAYVWGPTEHLSEKKLHCAIGFLTTEGGSQP